MIPGSGLLLLSSSFTGFAATITMGTYSAEAAADNKKGKACALPFFVVLFVQNLKTICAKWRKKYKDNKRNYIYGYRKFIVYCTLSAKLKTTKGVIFLKAYEKQDIRNVCVLGHGGVGKTSLTEAMLFLGQGSDRLGKIADGNTSSDYDVEEVKRKISIYTTVQPLEWKNKKINHAYLQHPR